jgi:hypothetical protein
VREHVPGAAGGKIQSVLVTPAKKAKEGAAPHLSRVSYWGLEEFREWANTALDTIRELRRTFTEPGHLAWRAEAASKLEAIRADAPRLSTWLPVRTHRPPADQSGGVDNNTAMLRERLGHSRRPAGP